MSLVNAIGAPEWAQSTAFNTVEGRLENKGLIESHLSQWVGPAIRTVTMSFIVARG